MFSTPRINAAPTLRWLRALLAPSSLVPLRDGISCGDFERDLGSAEAIDGVGDLRPAAAGLGLLGRLHRRAMDAGLLWLLSRRATEAVLLWLPGDPGGGPGGERLPTEPATVPAFPPFNMISLTSLSRFVSRRVCTLLTSDSFKIFSFCFRFSFVRLKILTVCCLFSFWSSETCSWVPFLYLWASSERFILRTFSPKIISFFSNSSALLKKRVSDHSLVAVFSKIFKRGSDRFSSSTVTCCLPDSGL